MTTKKRTDRAGTRRPNAKAWVHLDPVEQTITIGCAPGIWVSTWPAQDAFSASMYVPAAKELVAMLIGAIAEAERLELIRENSLAGLTEDQKKALGLA